MAAAIKHRPPPPNVRPSSKRAKLHAADPRCFWCGVETVLDYPQNGTKATAESATIDHLYSRLHPERNRPRGNDRNELLHVLACHRCNHERSVAEQRGRVFVPRLKHRQGIARNTSATVTVARSVTTPLYIRKQTPLTVVLPPVVGLKCPICDKVRPVGAGCCAK